MKRHVLFASVLAAGLLIPAMGSLCAPADAWTMDVQVQPPTVVIGPAQPTVTEETVVYEHPVVERRVVERRVRYVPVRQVVYRDYDDDRYEHGRHGHHDNGRHRGHGRH